MPQKGLVRGPLAGATARTPSPGMIRGGENDLERFLQAASWKSVQCGAGGKNWSDAGRLPRTLGSGRSCSLPAARALQSAAAPRGGKAPTSTAPAGESMPFAGTRRSWCVRDGRQWEPARRPCAPLPPAPRPCSHHPCSPGNRSSSTLAATARLVEK